MKKTVKLLIMVLFLVNVVFLSVDVKASSVPSLNTIKKTIYVGSTYQLKLKNSDGSVKWESSNISVAQVLDSGLVIGIKKGKATITAIYDGYKYTCSITVKNPGLNKTKATIQKGKKLSLKVNGDVVKSWKSSNKYVATVSKSGVVKAISLGTAKITVKCENGTYSCSITVRNPNLMVGDIIKMGKWEQDNNSYNGTESVEWVVLATEKDKALLISNNILFDEKFNSNENIDEPYWETSTLRKWLNNTVYDSMFTSEEKKNIIESIVPADINPESKDTSQGQATKDKLFCLSVKEVYEYGANTYCTPVSAVAGAETWLTRSRDYWNWGYRFVGAFIGPSYKEVGSCFNYGVRPAMWIKM